MQSTQSRRRFLATLSSAGVAGMIGAPHSLAAEPPPETITVRFPKFSNTICGAPVLVIDELLRAEGFTDVRYVRTTSGAAGIRLAARGEVDFENAFVGTHVTLIDAGSPITILGGLHIGCYELFAHGDIRSIRDLKGKTVGVAELGSSPHILVSSMASYVGLDPIKEIQWVVSSAENPLELFANGKIDAFLGFPPEPQELHARKIGRVIVQYGTRPAMVAVFLLHGCGQLGLRAQASCGEQAGLARDTQGNRLLCSRSRKSRAAISRRRVHRSV